jgi:hypothetical protein
MPGSTSSIRAGRAFVELFADDSKLVRGLRRAEKKLRAFGDSIRGFGLKLAGLGSAMLAPLAASAKLFSSYGDQVAKMAKRTGLSVETLSELRFVASQTGTEFESLEMAFRKMQRSIYDAGRGLSTQVDALTDLGLTFQDLDGLSPEDQFKRLADRIGQIEDPTTRAAIAMTLFGRTGTNLLPMFAAGSAGIEALQEQARALGLTMSAEDAKAAEDFTDALDRLWKVVRMGAFNVGAALAPVLQGMADTMTRLVVMVSDWIKQNRRIIVTVLKVAAAVLVAGVALIALGSLISGVAAAVGMLASIITGVGAALGALAGAIMFLVSPIGVVITALGVLGAYLLKNTGIAGQALDWLGDRFSELKDTAMKAYQGMADALAAGDLGLAAKILWLTLKMEWIKGVNALKGIWLAFRGFIADVLVGAFTGALAALETVWHGLEVGWIETTALLIRGWHGFVNIFMRSWERMKALATKVWNWIKGLFNDTIDVGAVNVAVDRALEQRLADIDQDTGQAVIGADLRRQTRRQRAAGIHEQTLGVIGQRYEDEQARQTRQRAQAEKDAEHALIEARQEWEQAIADARQQRTDAQSHNPQLPQAPQPPDLSDLGELLEREAARIGAVGSFNPAALLGMAFSTDTAERTANAAEETARNTKRIEREMRTGNLAFA